MGVDLVEQWCSIGVVHLEAWAIFFKQEQVFKFLEVVQILYSCFMFLPVNNFIADEVIFDDIFETPIISE